MNGLPLPLEIQRNIFSRLHTVHQLECRLVSSMTRDIVDMDLHLTVYVNRPYSIFQFAQVILDTQNIHASDRVDEVIIHDGGVLDLDVAFFVDYFSNVRRLYFEESAIPNTDLNMDVAVSPEQLNAWRRGIQVLHQTHRVHPTVNFLRSGVYNGLTTLILKCDRRTDINGDVITNAPNVANLTLIEPTVQLNTFRQMILRLTSLHSITLKYPILQRDPGINRENNPVDNTEDNRRAYQRITSLSIILHRRRIPAYDLTAWVHFIKRLTSLGYLKFTFPLTAQINPDYERRLSELQEIMLLSLGQAHVGGIPVGQPLRSVEMSASRHIGVILERLTRHGLGVQQVHLHSLRSRRLNPFGELNIHSRLIQELTLTLADTAFINGDTFVELEALRSLTIRYLRTPNHPNHPVYVMVDLGHILSVCPATLSSLRLFRCSVDWDWDWSNQPDFDHHLTRLEIHGNDILPLVHHGINLFLRELRYLVIEREGATNAQINFNFRDLNLYHLEISIKHKAFIRLFPREEDRGRNMEGFYPLEIYRNYKHDDLNISHPSFVRRTPPNDDLLLHIFDPQVVNLFYTNVTNLFINRRFTC